MEIKLEVFERTTRGGYHLIGSPTFTKVGGEWQSDFGDIVIKLAEAEIRDGHVYPGD